MTLTCCSMRLHCSLSLSARPSAWESATGAFSITVSPVLKSATLSTGSRIPGSLSHRILIFLLRPNLLTSQSNLLLSLSLVLCGPSRHRFAVLDPPTQSLCARRFSDCGTRRSQHDTRDVAQSVSSRSVWIQIRSPADTLHAPGTERAMCRTV